MKTANRNWADLICVFFSVCSQKNISRKASQVAAFRGTTLKKIGLFLYGELIPKPLGQIPLSRLRVNPYWSYSKIWCNIWWPEISISSRHNWSQSKEGTKPNNSVNCVLIVESTRRWNSGVRVSHQTNVHDFSYAYLPQFLDGYATLWIVLLF